MPPLPLHADVFAALDRGALVLTANQRAALTLHGVYARKMRAEGKTLWQPPAISAWESWTSSLWQQLILRGAEARILLSPMQERLLWKKILADDAASQTLRSSESLAILAAEAWGLLAQYGGLDAKGGLAAPLRAQFEAASTDTRTFLRWAQQFERRCRKDLLLPSAQLDAALIPHTADSKLPAGAVEIILLGFDRMPPATVALCEALRESGLAVHTMAPSDTPQSLRIVETKDEAAEMELVARSLRERLTEHPHINIAVIVPDVASVRSRIERVFLNQLAPELQVVRADAQRPFEFSLGATLDRLPLTRAALSLLRWTIAPQPLEEVSALLLSPYLAGAQSERYARATWDAQRLRRARLLEPEIQLAWILKQENLPSALQSQLSAVQILAVEKNPAASRSKKPALASYTAWMEHAAALLAAAGWPGGQERPLDSTEFQLQERWQNLLDEIATLDFAGERVTFAAALTAIESAAAETLFAPQSRNAPVQIMSARESAGSAFDAIWFLGATDMAWPAAAGTHPFIPWTVQRDLTMPGTDATRTLDEGIAMTQRIVVSAPEVTFSFARHNSESEQRASTCLHAIEKAEWLQDGSTVSLPVPAVQLEDALDDTTLPALADKVIPGGATILKLQAQCPFRAFAERRLASQPLENIEAGLDAQERGNLIHNVLATFWNGVRTQSALQQMSAAERMQRLETAVDAALRMTAENAWQEEYLQVQRAWLLQLLPQWLDEELTRPPFQVIATERKLADQHIGPLRIDVRVDRIDAALPDGQEFSEENKLHAPLQIILDYKTGLASKKSWEGPRPDEPQLPLYAALAAEETLHGVAFARLRPGAMDFDGIASAQNLLKRTKLKQDGTPYANSEVDDVGFRVAEWRDVLTTLAEDFARGESSVDPKQYPQTCEHCDQMPLCRIQESRARSDEDEESEEAAYA